jgi:type IV pilus assembly protein PilA
MKLKYPGFAMIEMMVVIGIMIFLSMLVVPNFMKMLAKAKRTEAYVTLRSLYLAEKAYFMEHGSYTNTFGSGGLSWKPEGNLNYTYGFPGSEGSNFFTGVLKTSSSHLGTASVSSTGFTIAAAGDIDADGLADVLTINQDGVVQIVSDDL